MVRPKKPSYGEAQFLRDLEYVLGPVVESLIEWEERHLPRDLSAVADELLALELEMVRELREMGLIPAAGE
jgi:hypothetical protein